MPQPQWVTLDHIEKYMMTAGRPERLKMLQTWRQKKQNLPFYVTKDFFALRLSADELSHLIELTQPSSKLEFEFWVFESLLRWSQDLAAAALRCWANQTDCQLWHRLLPILKIPGLPQRLHYTILDIAPLCAGHAITNTAVQAKGWEDYSPAYLGLLFDRAIQFNIASSRLNAMAKKILTAAQTQIHPEDKALESAIAFLLYSGDDKFVRQAIESEPDAPWKHFALAALDQHGDSKKSLEKITKSLTKDASFEKAITTYPSPWSRKDISADCLAGLLAVVPAQFSALERILNGIPGDTIAAAFAELPQAKQEQLLPVTRGLHERGQSNLDLFHEERKTMLEPNGSLGSVKFKSYADLKSSEPDASTVIPLEYATKSIFFNTVCGKDTKGDLQKDFWSQAAHVWRDGTPASLPALATEARKQKGLGVIAYIMTLGRLKGSDEAVLKLMDHVRTTDEDELRAIVFALGDIDNTRSLLELISVITRPNATLSIQQDAVGILSKKDMSALQKELRATVQDLHVPQMESSPLSEIKDILSSLLEVHAVPSNASVSQPTSNKGTIDDKALDHDLVGMIPNYRDLSSEVRRALRTALFFNKSISGSEATHAIDLSPLIDMQYKAMELLFREFFEDAVSQSLQRGDIPRKLDVIGYARPIPYKMDEFESYIANLPVVKEIPFFSKFKLRKMLRAICQFEPGRRFTLDGLKAFGLFFLCFARFDCRFGLNQTFAIGTKDDRELAEFAKELHIFQDFRNRAAHEGFHPEASNDIQGIWRTTALIVQWAFRIRSYLTDAGSPKTAHRAS